MQPTSKFYLIPPDLVARVEAMAGRVRLKMAAEQNGIETLLQTGASEATLQPSDSLVQSNDTTE